MIHIGQVDDPWEEDEWCWNDGSEVDFTSWLGEHPRNNNGQRGCSCMVTDQENPEKLGKWKSAKCVGDLQAFVCKRPAFGAKYIYFHDLVD